MDPAVLQSQIAALHKGMAEEADSLARWSLSGDFLEEIREGLVPDIPGFQEAWELARDVRPTLSRDPRTLPLSLCLPSVCSRVAASTAR